MTGAGAKVFDISGVASADSRKKKNILIIDDEESLLESLEWLLSDDFNVFKATDGKKGFDLLRNLPIDLLILDLKLPGMGGTAILENIKGPSFSEKVPVIVITAHSTVERAEICAHHMAVHGYFRKPLDADDLLERVMEILHEDKRIKDSPTNPFKPAFFNKLSDPVKRAIEFINNHYTEPIKPKDVADHVCAQVCVSKKYLGKKFKTELGHRMDEYINSLRVDEAMKLLCENRDMRPSRMWEPLGFSDICDFFRWFKRRTGITPTAYRKRYGAS
ncbi:MAG: hypothetical protein A2V86_17705 [Deltaproteobacteria bacterium RBG_16_49_23]|nr:MAG: hypothetical protein A2V86_17705 [Deltaproteobacteria bacterium RBG_16_49_23]